jgi:hypothetical protein
MPGFLLLALALLVVVGWLVDLGLGIGWLWVRGCPSRPGVADRRANFGGVRGSFRMYPMQMADANDLLGGQQD